MCIRWIKFFLILSLCLYFFVWRKWNLKYIIESLINLNKDVLCKVKKNLLMFECDDNRDDFYKKINDFFFLVLIYGYIVFFNGGI